MPRHGLIRGTGWLRRRRRGRETPDEERGSAGSRRGERVGLVLVAAALAHQAGGHVRRERTIHAARPTARRGQRGAQADGGRLGAVAAAEERVESVEQEERGIRV